MADGPRDIAIARPAATILLVRDAPFEVLMVRRHPEQTFSSALVFPGGTVDESDRADDWLDLVTGGEALDSGERALRIAALRETFEETAILLARDADGRPVPCVSTARDDFRAVVAESGGTLWLDDLVKFGHWITPVNGPKRFDTHFFLAAAPDGQEAKCDGGEAVALEWASPDAILARASAGERSILFPTRMNLRRLAESDTVDAALAAARARSVFTVLPRVERREGGMAVLIPHEAGYGETENFHPRAEMTGHAAGQPAGD
ncbi:NUDIX hydrolase [Sphingobium sp.]|uniref:NUDIX hydrolase n=1 Tax=Sphingobium sp. TaxID=1912891 RepID=UPI001A1A2756|nr:NUDIX hydrolase [Sphingobium sp.]MBJ7375300.1 NUDIX hydrolase [Sphingobium sp.]